MPSCGVSVCLSVRLSRSWIMSKRITYLHFFSPSGSHTILVFPYQTGWRYSDGISSNGDVEWRWGRKKNVILDKYVTSLHTDLQCYEPIKRSVKNKAATDGRRAHCGIRRLFPQDDNEMFVTGLTLHAGDEVNPPPRTQPPWSCGPCVAYILYVA